LAPNSFSVTNPARVALDLPATVNDLGRNSVEVNQGDLRSVNVVQAQGRVRVVLNLRRPLPYTMSIKGSNLVVALGANVDAPTFAPAPDGGGSRARGADRRDPRPRSIRSMDFRRGTDGEGRVVVDLSDPNTSVDVHQQGQNRGGDFAATNLPEALRKAPGRDRLRYAGRANHGHAAGRPTRTWSSSRAANGSQNAYQSDNRFVVRGQSPSRKTRRACSRGRARATKASGFR